MKPHFWHFSLVVKWQQFAITHTSKHNNLRKYKKCVVAVFRLKEKCPNALRKLLITLKMEKSRML